MTFRASYDEMYLEEAAGNLGDAFDWVTNTCGGNIQDFANRFAESEISELFAKIAQIHCGHDGCRTSQRCLDRFEAANIRTGTGFFHG